MHWRGLKIWMFIIVTKVIKDKIGFEISNSDFHYSDGNKDVAKKSKPASLPSASRTFSKTKFSSAGAHMTNASFCHEIDCKNILKGSLACACRTYLSCDSSKPLTKDGW